MLHVFRASGDESPSGQSFFHTQHCRLSGHRTTANTSNILRRNEAIAVNVHQNLRLGIVIFFSIQIQKRAI